MLSYDDEGDLRFSSRLDRLGESVFISADDIAFFCERALASGSFCLTPFRIDVMGCGTTAGE